MSSSVLALLGEDAVLRGIVSCRVNIEHGVQMEGYGDDMVVERSVATIQKSCNPARGDTLAHPDGTFKLDSIVNDNGHTVRFVVLPV